MSPKLNRAFIITISIILILTFIAENINHRFWLNDFKVYYLASQAFFSDIPIYNNVFGIGIYKYSPSILLVFSVFNLLPYYWASVLYFFIICTVIIFIFKKMYQLLPYLGCETEKSNGFLLPFIGFLFIFSHLFRELHLGNVNVIMLFFNLLILQYIFQKKPVKAGIFLSLILFLKPFFIIVCLPLIIHKQWKVIYSTIISSLIILIIFLCFSGPHMFFQLHVNWLDTILAHSDEFPSEFTMTSLIQCYFGIMLPGIYQYIIIAGLCIFCIIFYIIPLNKFKQKTENISLFGFNYLIWIGILPNLVKTDKEHFLLSFPLIIILLVNVFKQFKWYKLIPLVIIFIFYSINSSDILSSTVHDYFDSHGFLGLGNLLIVVTFFIFKNIKNYNATTL